MKTLRHESGFTLVELMLVVLIIGILVAIALPVFNSAESSAQKRSCYANERTTEGAFQTYRADTATATVAAAFTDYASVMAVLSPQYVKSPPVCNASGAYSLVSANPTAAITVVCSAGGHGTHP